ncbi:ClC family H(+)/Cl(-) exchange transporter [Parafannyhessea umbonata]|uniref:ClC family H(+)/Cl(-) exchange transporter n=1 Tax=Parafannyhessea umbonata TaxID=604330 RepID=A0A6N7WTN2_9ACTN|nr:ClC family H(+)/Cl(-) exchange transporter [Parafannyhessea umbonata]MST60165.1 ClC family H(+)/Cl(-) exchange transporter [Parafannyhessea umbonata]
MARRKDIVTRHFSRRFQVYMIGEGLFVGLAAGAVVSLYRLALSHAETLLRAIAAAIQSNWAFLPLWFAFLVVICGVVCRLMVWEPFTQGSGIPQIDAEVIGRLDMPWWRVLSAKFVEGTLCALGGLSLGREGPSVQLGGMAGKAVSKLMGRERGEERLLTTCGAAAGMSAAFNAPLTGVLFAIEEIHKEFNAPLIVSVMAAAISSDFVVSQVLGVKPVLQFVFAADLPHHSYLFVIALGIFCGVAGAAHNRGMFWMTEQFDKIRQHAPYTRLIIPFLASGVLIFLTPDLACGGDAIVEKLATQQSLAIGTIALLLLGKYLFTTLCFGSGAPGGTLFPLCVMGALLGCLFGRLAVSYLGLPSVFVTNFIVLGIGGLFASVVRAPVTAVVLAFELTGSMDALLSVSIVSILSYVTANLLQVDAFYEHLLGRLLGNMGRKDPDRLDGSGEKCLQNFVVGAGSECEGKLIRDIAWPESVRVVLIDRAGEEVVPTGSVKLQALDNLLLILDANKQDEVRERLWQMLGSSLTSNWRPKSSRVRRKIRKIRAEHGSR